MVNHTTRKDLNSSAPSLACPNRRKLTNICTSRLYELAPYRLATVAGGAFIAFFWTVFPSPFTDRTWLRKDLSAVLYLLANYSSVIHTTMRATMLGTVGDMEVPGSPAQKLFKVRRKMFGKLTLLLPSLQLHANFQKFEPSIGGKFPEEQYQDIILRSTRSVPILSHPSARDL